MRALSQAFTRRGICAGAALLPLATPALAKGARRLRLAATWPRNLPGLWDGATRFAARVEALSAGDLTVELIAAGEGPDARDIFDAVRGGDIDLYHGAEYHWQGRARAFNFFTTVPFGFVAAEHAGWIRHGGGQALWDELSAQYGLKGLMCGNTGVQMGGWYDRPIRALADMKGLRIRIPGVAAEIFRALGSEPVVIPDEAIPAALFAGEINAVESASPYNDLDFGVQKILRHYMYPGFHEPGSCASLGLNLRLWEGFSERERAIVETAAMAENRMMPAQYAAHSGRALEQMKLEYGTDVRRFPDPLYRQVAQLSEGVLRDIGQTDSFAARTVESFLTFRAAQLAPAREMTGRYVALRQSGLIAPEPLPEGEIAD